MSSQIIYLYDAKIQRVVCYKFIAKTKNELYLYENINTGCKQCFSKTELKELLEDSNVKTMGCV